MKHESIEMSNEIRAEAVRRLNRLIKNFHIEGDHYRADRLENFKKEYFEGGNNGVSNP